jgi:predicted ATPase/class 3 adenylate cyclase
MDTTASFGYWLRRRRRALDLTQEALAKRVGCAVVTISKFERDELRPSRQIAERLAICLEITSQEHAVFIKVARAELSVDRLPLATQPVNELVACPPAPGVDIPDSYHQTSAALPTGTVTLLFADIVDSRQLWQQHSSAMPETVTRYAAIVGEAIGIHGGTVFRRSGETVYGAFTSAMDALAAALVMQRALQDESWGEIGPLLACVALHTGNIIPQNGQYSGLPIRRTECILEAGHAGQVLVSCVTQELVRDELPRNVKLLDLGQHQLKDLIRPEHIFQLVALDLPNDFPPIITLDQHLTNLPVQPTPFIGREHEVAAVCQLLCCADLRLLTLLGSGGIGKTRLALQAASDLLGVFTDGVYFVALAPISEPNLVALTIAQTLGIKEVAGQLPLEAMTRHLRDKKILLLLDNFEQVVAAASVVAALMAATTNLKFLVTSRAPLRVYGEHEHVVLPLALPDLTQHPRAEHLIQYDALRLFIERAQAVKHDFVVTNDNARAVAEICYRLDGLPLAIELAAARIKLLNPQALLSRLSNRLKLLTGGSRNWPLRQQTLRATIAWSYELMPSVDQILFARLAVFVNGGMLEAIEAICNADGNVVPDLLDSLQVLIDNSLVRQDVDANAEPRLRMLETIREYALEQLAVSGEEAELRARHAAYYLELAEAGEPKFHTDELEVWVDRLEAEHDNLRAALTWALDHAEADLAVRLGAALWHFWEIRGHLTEGRRWLAAALDQGQDVAAAPRAAAFTGAGTIAYHQGDYAQATVWHEQALQLYQSVGDMSGIAFALNNLGAQAERQGDLASAMRYLAESLELAQQLGHIQLSVYVLNNIGIIARHQADYQRAAEVLTQALAVSRTLENQWLICNELIELATVAWYQNNDAHALTLYTEALILCKKIGQPELIAECLEGLAGCAVRQRQGVRATRLLGAAAQLRETINAPLPPVEYQRYTEMVGLVQAALDPATYEATWVDSRRTPLEGVIVYALSTDESS